jgi:hypothetical protein
MNRKWLIVVLALASAPAFACQFDSDCNVGWQCLKQLGQTEGTCTSNRAGGHADDAGLSRDPTDPARSAQHSCDVDLDCGAMGKCLRAQGRASGVCSSGAGGIHGPH